jgi:hypothetical protein
VSAKGVKKWNATLQHSCHSIGQIFCTSMLCRNKSALCRIRSACRLQNQMCTSGEPDLRLYRTRSAPLQNQICPSARICSTLQSQWLKPKCPYNVYDISLNLHGYAKFTQWRINHGLGPRLKKSWAPLLGFPQRPSLCHRQPKKNIQFAGNHNYRGIRNSWVSEQLKLQAKMYIAWRGQGC